MLERVQTIVRKQRLRVTLLAATAGVMLFTLGVLVGQGRLPTIHSTNYSNRTGLGSSVDYQSVNELYDVLRARYDGKLSETQVLDGLKHGLAASAQDPYTTYFTATEAKSFNDNLQHTFSGIGAELELDTAGNVVVVAPLEGSPAAAAGVRAKDIIVSIDGKSTSGMSVSDAVLKIRGKKDTQVKLELVRNKTEQVSVTITRGDIQAPTATSKILDGNIGYLQINQFSSNTMDLVNDAVTTFKQAGVQKIVLDLRDNSGGEVGAAVGVSSLWLTRDKVVMQEKRGSQLVHTTYAKGKNQFQGIKTVVLINAGSASASEITAAALHDNKAATIMGETSYGKGVEQELIDLDDGGQLKVTVASWYRPNGTNITGKGIAPDKTVKMTEDDYKNKTDPQLDAATAFLKQ